jgi:hypothetical protein
MAVSLNAGFLLSVRWNPGAMSDSAISGAARGILIPDVRCERVRLGREQPRGASLTIPAQAERS